MMSAQETAKRLLSERNYEVAEETVRLLQAFPGVRDTEIQELMERMGWLIDVNIEALGAEYMGLDDFDWSRVFFGVRLVQRPDWLPIENYIRVLATEAVEWHRVVGICNHLAQLKWTRVHDRKKPRRQLWGEAKYWVMALVRRLGKPYGPWLLQQFEQELAATGRD